jgi:ABC-type bacteriocin/lantibiotic exporter with double-glycine peptidase domain
LLRGAPILLLDEATSALDVATEQRILSNLQSRNWARTCILVTHRPASTAICNRGYEIHDGRVTEILYEA